MERDRKALPAPKKETLTASIAACKRNGERLLEDAQQLEFQEPPSTKMVLSMLAQEEFAKAFFLYLTREDIIPWCRELLRAMHDHSCKRAS